MSLQLDIDLAAQALVSPHLYAREKLLWVGKPTPIRVLMYNRGNLVIVTMTIAFVFVWFTLTGFGFLLIADTQIRVLSLFLIPVAGLLIYVIYRYWRATQIVYAISNRRALIIKPTIDGTSVLAYNVIPYIERRSRANGKGDLIFASQAYTRVLANNFQREGSYTVGIRKIGFFGIDNALQVEELMVKTFSSRIHPNSDDS